MHKIAMFLVDWSMAFDDKTQKLFSIYSATLQPRRAKARVFRAHLSATWYLIEDCWAYANIYGHACAMLNIPPNERRELHTLNSY